MARFIRWQGLVAFIILSALVTVTLYFFAETLVKKALVSAAESTFGAEVNIDAVKLGYSPLHISILGLQVTDKESPSHNIFSFEQATAGVDVWQYLFGKIIIEQLEVSQLAFSGTRAQVGQVYVEKSENTVTDSFTEQAKAMMPEMEMKLPNVKTLLNDDNLLTVKASNELQASYQAERAKFTALKSQLPTKEKLKLYQDKVKALSKMEVKTLADIDKIKIAYDKIKADFKGDQALVKQAKQQVLISKDLLTSQVSVLKSAPQKDWQQIEKTYQLESIDTEDFAHIIFGEQARGYVQKTQWFYQQVSPFMADIGADDTDIVQNSHAKGRFVYFKEDLPLPSVLIKKALLSMTLPQGDFTIKASELTHQHWLRGKDSVLTIASVSNGEFNVNSSFRFTQSGVFSIDGDWLINNRVLSNTQLTTSKAFSLTLEKANLSGKGAFTVIDSELVATNHFALQQVSYQGEAETKITNLLLATMKSLDKLTIDIAAKGALAKPSLSISSSLNDALTGAFKQQVAGKLDDFKEKVNTGLNDKLVAALKLGDSQSAELLDLEALLTDTDSALADLKNSDVVKQQQQKLADKLKNKAKDKIKDKLKGKLGGFFG